jgi:DNA-binding NarL/FixJ family response regulator/anti-sigma regulatory factor (Ser/Thr protein kinase)
MCCKEWNMSTMDETLKFLIVSDSHVERTFLRGVLEQEWPGCHVREVANAEDGLRAAQQEPPHLLLTDYGVAPLFGVCLVKKLHCSNPQLPVVVITASGCKQSAIEALQAGAASYVSKSTSRHELISVLTNVLALTQVERHPLRVIGCLANMDLRFEIGNDSSLVQPLVLYLQDQTRAMRVFDENELRQLGVALYETLTNAINHGNLELDSKLRQEDESVFHDLARSRQAKWPYCIRKVHVLASYTRQQVTFVIRDEGRGFNHVQVSDPTQVENLDRIGGRGLLLIRTFMDEVHHNECGNEITLVKHHPALRPHSVESRRPSLPARGRSSMPDIGSKGQTIGMKLNGGSR